MSDEAWRWDERGSTVVVDRLPAGGLRVEVSVTDYPPGLGILLPPRALAELAEWLDAQLDVPSYSQVAELEAEARQLEAERDEAVARAERAEQQVAERDRLLTIALERLERAEVRAAGLKGARS